ncbi:MAG: MgtC/SapB family protein [Candidatus Margulisiibacteriota bacterium]
MGELAIVGQLMLSGFFGGAIGFVREMDKKAAGLRTHTLVCIGSTLFMLVSLFMAEKFPGADAGRIAAQVVTGIGFIGAGAIMQSGGAIRGLTTATSIWVTAAIGLAVGCGFYTGAAAATLITLVVIEVLRKLEQIYFKEKQN